MIIIDSIIHVIMIIITIVIIIIIIMIFIINIVTIVIVKAIIIKIITIIIIVIDIIIIILGPLIHVLVFTAIRDHRVSWNNLNPIGFMSSAELIVAIECLLETFLGLIGIRLWLLHWYFGMYHEFWMMWNIQIILSIKCHSVSKSSKRSA